MLQKLPSRLRSYTGRVQKEDLTVVVLIDEDRQDCHALKQQIEQMAIHAGLTTKSNARPGAAFHVVTRIAVEELEAWFIGDVEALRAAYPRVSGTLASNARYRDPDAVAGGTWEALHRVLKNSGYYRGIFPKLEVARSVAKHMVPYRNKSHSFRVFCAGVEAVFV